MLSNNSNVVFETPRNIGNLTPSQKEILDDSNKKIIYIPQKVYDNIENEKNDLGNYIPTFTTISKEYNDQFKYNFVQYDELTIKEKQIFDYTSKILGFFKLGSFEDKVFISETIKPNQFGIDDSNGCWDSNEGKIIIKRNQLKSLENYAGTLIHELLHARYGYNDITREFENKLTQCIGFLVSCILLKK